METPESKRDEATSGMQLKRNNKREKKTLRPTKPLLHAASQARNSDR